MLRNYRTRLIINKPLLIQVFYEKIEHFKIFGFFNKKYACETFHKARLPVPPLLDIFPREHRRAILAQASGALI